MTILGEIFILIALTRKNKGAKKKDELISEIKALDTSEKINSKNVERQD
jgi:hypothetical protein